MVSDLHSSQTLFNILQTWSNHASHQILTLNIQMIVKGWLNSIFWSSFYNQQSLRSSTNLILTQSHSFSKHPDILVALKMHSFLHHMTWCMITRHCDRNVKNSKNKGYTRLSHVYIWTVCHCSQSSVESYRGNHGLWLAGTLVPRCILQSTQWVLN